VITIAFAHMPDDHILPAGNTSQVNMVTNTAIEIRIVCCVETKFFHVIFVNSLVSRLRLHNFIYPLIRAYYLDFFSARDRNFI